ncbi:MAG: SAM-dependent methyltransferase [Terriglobales bacterium]
MPSPVVSPVSHVSDTARWVAMYRAMESDRPDALFHDTWARKLAGAEGEAILNSIPKGREFAWPMIVRTHVMDELILRTIAQDGVDTVLNLASGLDARPYRLPLPASLRWIEVDFADVLSYKQTILAGERPHCALEFAPVDLTDNSASVALFTRIGASSSRTFVITEGLLGYLQSEQVVRLASDLSAQPSFRWWLIDLASPDLLKRINKTWGKSLQRAPLIFGPAEGTKFFEPCGWREKEYRSTFDESLRLNRTMRFARFFRLIGRFYPKKMRERFKRFSGIVLFERK